jgi:hypothetical protein
VGAIDAANAADIAIGAVAEHADLPTDDDGNLLPTDIDGNVVDAVVPGDSGIPVWVDTVYTVVDPDFEVHGCDCHK